ncbi:MAG: hypothetical protein KAY24_05550, partial [Candidatus Eisenbacteria sp.]|nr:hypothetical protein [Candidatus Eisenbacteria bacterium]
MRTIVLVLCCGVLFWIGVAAAETYTVRPDGTGDYPTIQTAIDAVVDGDVIELTDGTFYGDGNRDLDYLGKAITVRSQSGIQLGSIIDCEGSEVEPHRGFWFHSGETAGTVLEGITIHNGWAAGPDPLDYSGGGVLCSEGASPQLVDVVFLYNFATQGGAVMCIDESTLTLKGCMFVDNSAIIGGGMFCTGGSTPTLLNCTFIGNAAEAFGGGIYCRAYGFPTLESTIIAFSQSGEAIYSNYTPCASMVCCDVYGNAGGDWVGCIEELYGVDGNISEDPLFCDPGGGDWTLQACSPCAPFSPP